ncbi:YggL family protein [Vibrio furnissii]|uniref:YggL 50S ribosome-binding family protein n=1 Tax=Vibrio furnissii TaxID=29494 RepID=UPI001EEB4FB0|nr:YggL family protein [Vibrio furnissii]MCG6234222.1 YggL family protein [Vibrio furnissii]MCG6259270.1 YggL family protein [Vibrio furnissii]
MTTNRSKRLRKKLYVGEFQVLGFAFSCKVNADDDTQYDVLLDSFIDFIESRNLVMGGGANHESFDGFVVAEGRYDSATDEDRAAVEKWLSEQAMCSQVQVEALVDINHGE